MTQQSLITRLKAVEEALEVSRKRVAVSGNDEELSLISAALSDLRELIKEAEGQEPRGSADMYVTDEDHVTRHIVKPLYTALGEKP